MLVACQDGATGLMTPPTEAPPAPSIEQLGLENTLVTLVEGGPTTLQAVSLDAPETVLDVAPLNPRANGLQEDIRVHPAIWSAGAKDRFEVADGRDRLLFEAHPGAAPRLLARRPYDLHDAHLPPPTDQEVAWFDGQVHLRSLDNTEEATQTFDVGEAYAAALTPWTAGSWAVVTLDASGERSLWRVTRGAPAQRISDRLGTSTSVLSVGTYLVLWHRTRPALVTVSPEGTVSTLEFDEPMVPMAKWQNRLLLGVREATQEALLLDLETGDRVTLPTDVYLGSWPSYGEAPVIAAPMVLERALRIVDLRTKAAYTLPVEDLGRVRVAADPARNRLLAVSLSRGLLSALDLQSGAVLRRWTASFPRSANLILGPRGRWLAYGTRLIDLDRDASYSVPAPVTHITAGFAYLEPPAEPDRLFELRPGLPRRLLGAVKPWTDAHSYPELGVVLVEDSQLGLRLLRPGSESPEIWRGQFSVLDQGKSGDRIWVQFSSDSLLWFDMSTDPPQVSEARIGERSDKIVWHARRSLLARSLEGWFELSPDVPPRLVPEIPAQAMLYRAGEGGVWVKSEAELARLNDDGSLQPSVPWPAERAVVITEVTGGAYLNSELPNGDPIALGVDLTGDPATTSMPPQALWYGTRESNTPWIGRPPVDGMGRLLSIHEGRLLAFSVDGTPDVLLESEHPLTWVDSRGAGWIALASQASGTEIWAGDGQDAHRVGNIVRGEPRSVVWLTPERASVTTTFDESVVVDTATRRTRASPFIVSGSIDARFATGYVAGRALTVLDLSSGQSARLDPLSVGREFMMLALPAPLSGP